MNADGRGCARKCDGAGDHGMRHRASAICWTATVCGAPVAARPDHVKVEFFIHGEPLRRVFDTAAVRGCDVERANKSQMHRMRQSLVDGTCQPSPSEYCESCRPSMYHSLKTSLPRARALLLASALFSLAGQGALAQGPTTNQPWAYLLLHDSYLLDDCQF